MPGENQGWSAIQEQMAEDLALSAMEDFGVVATYKKAGSGTPAQVLAYVEQVAVMPFGSGATGRGAASFAGGASRTQERRLKVHVVAAKPGAVETVAGGGVDSVGGVILLAEGDTVSVPRWAISRGAGAAPGTEDTDLVPLNVNGAAERIGGVKWVANVTA